MMPSVERGAHQHSHSDADKETTGYAAYSAQGGGAPVYSVTYGYDLAGQRRTGTETIVSDPTNDPTPAPRVLTWAYDGLYRLTGESWSGPGAREVTYAYDPAGNRVSRSVTTDGGATFVYTDYQYAGGGLNELAWFNTSGGPDAGTTQYDYDANGNLTSEIYDADAPGSTRRTTLYSYDVPGRLVRAERDGTVVFEAYYDARTRRLATVEAAPPPGGVMPAGYLAPTTATRRLTVFRYDGGTSFQELAEVDLTPGLDIAAELVRAGGLGGGIGSVLYRDRSMSPVMGPLPALPVEHYLYDGLGNVIAILDAAGVMIQSTRYDAFGNVVTQSGSTSDNTRLRNTKERSTALGLDNDGFRYYSPETGRYTTMDPLGFAAGDGLNLYPAVRNNPVNRVDPLGLSSKKDAQKTAQAIQQVQAEGYQAKVGGGLLNDLSDLWRDVRAVPGGVKQGFADTVQTIGLHGGNMLGLVSDDQMREQSPMVRYWAGHMSAGTTPVISEVQQLGAGLASGDPAAYRQAGLTALTAASGMKASGMMGRTSARGSGALRAVDGDASGSGGISTESTVSRANAVASGSTAIRRVGALLETPNDIMANPRLLEGKALSEVQIAVRDAIGWTNDVMRHSKSAPGGGWVLRELNASRSDLTGRMIQYHPGTTRHFDKQPYWKVSGVPGSGAVRMPAGTGGQQ
jgi:RHS repeat-associated protein